MFLANFIFVVSHLKVNPDVIVVKKKILLKVY